MLPKTPTLKRGISYLVRLLILCSLLLAITPTPARAGAYPPGVIPKQHCAFRYWTEKGDTIARIARKIGIPAQALADANKLPLNLKLREGMLLCVPVIPKTIKYPDSKLEVQVYGNHLLISGSNFPAKKTYIVRMRARWDDDWVKLGVLRTDKHGAFEDSFRIPKEYKETRYFEVCLKESLKGCKVCVYATRIW